MIRIQDIVQSPLAGCVLVSFLGVAWCGMAFSNEGSPSSVEPANTVAKPEASREKTDRSKALPWKCDKEYRDWKFVVVHHSATKQGNVESINRAHVLRKDDDGNPWQGIGYHFVIGNGQGMQDGEVVPTFRWNEQLHGAHAGVLNFNQHGIGICLIGNFDGVEPSQAQRASLQTLVRQLQQEFGIPSEGVLGHSDVRTTRCPGAKLSVTELRNELSNKEQTNKVDTPVDQGS